MAINKVYTVV